ncbi:MAG: dUTP diphosphatase [Cytophagaceae bacterium]
MSVVNIKIVNKSNNPLPQYQSVAAAGLDLAAFVESPVVLQPGQRQLITTGLYLELPIGFEAQIRPRSGLAMKSGVTVLNSPGTIDPDYRGEIKVLLINLSDHPFTIESGDRIAQMIIAKYEQVEFMEVEELSRTERATAGFGSTGV